MLRILVLLPIVLAAAAVQTLSIDSHLGTSVEDCFDRISIGERLPYNAIYRNVSELTTRECEQICKNDKQCQVYDYGVGAKGNATCDLSRINERDLKPLSIKHPDFDIYVRRVQCEQPPPLPFQPSLYDASEDGVHPEEGQIHKPIHRPEAEDPRRPVSDHHLTDLRPHESNFERPQFDDPETLSNDNGYNRPLDERPGIYRPFNDRPNYVHYRPYDEEPIHQSQRPSDEPSYGSFRPQNIPFRPEYDYRPSYGENRPQNYRPQYEYERYRPGYDTYDVVNFKGQYRPPYHQESYYPDPYYSQATEDEPDIYGQRPMRHPQVNIPEKPVYKYVNKPIQKYQRPNINNRYNPYEPIIKTEQNNPIRPYSYQTNNNKPNTNYNNEQNYNQVANHIEPSKPYGSTNGGYENYGGGLTGYGYGNHHYKPQYSQLNSQNVYGTITEIDEENNYRTLKPHNQNLDHVTVDNQNYENSHSSIMKSENSYNKPSHISGNIQSTINFLPGSNQSHVSTSDKLSTTQNSIKPQNSYEQNKPQKPGTNKNSYHNQASYAQSQPIFISNYRPSNQKPYHIQPNYQVTEKPYNYLQYQYGSSSNRPNYAEDRPTTSEQSYFNQKPYHPPNTQVTQKPYDNPYASTINRPAYGENRPNFDNASQNKPFYSESNYRPIKNPSFINHDTQKPYDYHSQYQASSQNVPVYGENRPILDQGYLNDRPDPTYDNLSNNQESSGYGVTVEDNRTKGLGTVKPSEDVKPSGDSIKSSGYVKSSGESVKHSEYVKPSGESIKPSGDYVKPSGDADKSSGESNKSSKHDVKSSGESIKPSGDDVKPSGDADKSSGDSIKSSKDDVKSSGESVKSNGEDMTSSGEIVTSKPMVIADYGGHRRPSGNMPPLLGRRRSYEGAYFQVDMGADLKFFGGGAPDFEAGAAWRRRRGDQISK